MDYPREDGWMMGSIKRGKEIRNLALRVTGQWRVGENMKKKRHKLAWLLLYHQIHST